MKKIISLLIIATTMLCSCHKDSDSEKTAPKATKVSIVLNFFTLEQQVTDAVDITILGTDFQGNEINIPVTEAKEYRWDIENPTFVEGEYSNPFAIEIAITDKAEPKTAEKYSGSIEYTMNCEVYTGNNTKPSCTKNMCNESSKFDTNSNITELTQYQNLLKDAKFTRRTYTFDYGLANDGSVSIGWKS